MPIKQSSRRHQETNLPDTFQEQQAPSAKLLKAQVRQTALKGTDRPQ